jgi:AMMECR1 domain-containing protein
MRVVMICLLSLAFCAVNAQEAAVDGWRHADESERAEALSLARKAFDAYAVNRTTLDPPSDLPDLLKLRTGVFVSAMRNGAPRCCMGSLYPTEANTAREIIASAIAAAGRDHRFAPIKPQELKGLNLIVSIVGQPRPIDAAAVAGLDPARDGIAVKYGDRFGVTLSGETNDVQRMLKWARTRAGAPANAKVQLFRLDDVRFVERPI